MVKRYGIIKAAEKAVNRPVEPMDIEYELKEE